MQCAHMFIIRSFSSVLIFYYLAVLCMHVNCVVWYEINCNLNLPISPSMWIRTLFDCIVQYGLLLVIDRIIFSPSSSYRKMSYSNEYLLKWFNLMIIMVAVCVFWALNVCIRNWNFPSGKSLKNKQTICIFLKQIPRNL